MEGYACTGLPEEEGEEPNTCLPVGGTIPLPFLQVPNQACWKALEGGGRLPLGWFSACTATMALGGVWNAFVLPGHLLPATLGGRTVLCLPGPGRRFWRGISCLSETLFSILGFFFWFGDGKKHSLDTFQTERAWVTFQCLGLPACPCIGSGGQVESLVPAAMEKSDVGGWEEPAGKTLACAQIG